MGFRQSYNVAICFIELTMLKQPQGCAYPLWPIQFSVYASSSFVRLCCSKKNR